MRRHFDRMVEDGGMFVDPMSKLPFQGKLRRIRIAVYRRYSEVPKKKKNTGEVDVVSELNYAVDGLISRLQQIGLKVRRMRGEHFYEWMVRFYNPKPELTGGNVDKLLKLFPYPKDSEDRRKPFGWSFAQNIFCNKKHY